MQDEVSVCSETRVNTKHINTVRAECANFMCFSKTAARFVMSVRMEQLGSHWTGFHEIRYLRIFRKSVEKIQI